MAKELIPHKMVVTYDDKGAYKNSTMLYRVRVDGLMDERKFYTLDVTKQIDAASIAKVLTDSKLHAESAEKISIKEGVE